MIISALFYLAGSILFLVVQVLPVWSPLPADFTTLIGIMFSYLNGFGWFIPLPDLYAALGITLTVDVILLSWMLIQWIRHNIPFLH